MSWKLSELRAPVDGTLALADFAQQFGSVNMFTWAFGSFTVGTFGRQS